MTLTNLLYFYGVSVVLSMISAVLYARFVKFYKLDHDDYVENVMISLVPLVNTVVALICSVFLLMSFFIRIFGDRK